MLLAHLKKITMAGILALLFFPPIQPSVHAELIFRGGYLVKMLPTSEGYNQFL